MDVDGTDDAEKYPNPAFKIIILDEADTVTPDAQAALRRIIVSDKSEDAQFLFFCFCFSSTLLTRQFSFSFLFFFLQTFPTNKLINAGGKFSDYTIYFNL